MSESLTLIFFFVGMVVVGLGVIFGFTWALDTFSSARKAAKDRDKRILAALEGIEQNTRRIDKDSKTRDLL